MEELNLKALIDFRRSSRLFLSSLLIILITILISMVAVFLFFNDFNSLDSKTFFPAVIFIVFLVFAISFLFQILFFKLFGAGKIIGIYSNGITELCFARAIKRNAFFSAHLLSNLIPLIIFVPFAIFFWNGIMFFALSSIFSNLLAYIPLYFAVFKYNKEDLFRFEREGVISIYN